MTTITEEKIEAQIEVKTLESEERQTIVHCSCDGDGTDAFVADDLHEIDKARIDILDPALAAPVALGREVDDELRVGQRPGLAGR